MRIVTEPQNPIAADIKLKPRYTKILYEGKEIGYWRPYFHDDGNMTLVATPYKGSEKKIEEFIRGLKFNG